MKEDHSFESLVTEEVKSEEVTLEETKKVTPEVKEETKIEENNKDNKKTEKKKINIGLIFLIFFILAIVFVYVFLGKPTFNFDATSGGESFYITFSKLEAKKEDKEEERLSKIEPDNYFFKTGLYIEQTGLFIERNKNDLTVCYAGEAKCYTSEIRVSDKKFYEDDEGTKAYIYEYVAFKSDLGEDIVLEANFEDVKLRVGENSNKYLSYVKNVNAFEGMYRSGDKYIVLFTSYDYLERLNQVNAIYYDGSNYGTLDFIDLLDTNKNNKFDDDYVDGAKVTLPGRIKDTNNTYKLIINRDQNNFYHISFEYKTYNEVSNTFEDVGDTYNTLVGSYTRTY